MVGVGMHFCFLTGFDPDMSGHQLKFTSLDGESRELDLKNGQVLWIKAGSHTTENTGKTEAHNLAVELKE